jgi:amino acid transporter
MECLQGSPSLGSARPRIYDEEGAGNEESVTYHPLQMIWKPDTIFRYNEGKRGRKKSVVPVLWPQEGWGSPEDGMKNMDQQSMYPQDSEQSETGDLEQASELERREIVTGSRLGQRYVRIEYPYAREFRPKAPGHLEATEAAAPAPRSQFTRMLGQIRRFLIGRPLTTAAAEIERMNRFMALAVLSSDALSSVAYATEASLAVLIAAGASALGVNLPIGIAVSLLMFIVATSYRQTIFAYPGGGGSYGVARENLGVWPGLIAAAALLVDYTLTVSVSISSGVDAFVSAFRNLQPFAVELGLLFIAVLVIGNLRGVREAGAAFAIPTYLFITAFLILIGVGIARSFIAPVAVPGHFPPPGPQAPPHGTSPLTILLILTAFASGCSAMTGVEAISNSVPVFKPPESRNAASTLTMLAVLLATLFMGINILDYRYVVEPYASGTPTVVAQIAERVFTGNWSWFFYVVQFSTLFVLVLAANTSFNGFPRLVSILAHDHVLPHWFAMRGDRLVYSTGIITLAIFAAILLVVFHGNTDALINLYALGVFTAFTMGQGGLVRRWLRLRSPGWQRNVAINGIGAVATAIVTVIIVVTKFDRGAWVVVVIIPLLLLMFRTIERHYVHIQSLAAARYYRRPEEIRHVMVVPVARMDDPTLQSLAYARSITAHVIAVHVSTTPAENEQLRQDWAAWLERTRDFRARGDRDHDPGSPELRILQASYRIRLPLFMIRIGVLLTFLRQLRTSLPDRKITVVLPERGVEHWWQQPFQRPLAFFLKASLFLRSDIAVADEPYHYGYRHGLATITPKHPAEVRHLVLVPFASINQPTLESLAYAFSISPRIIAVHVVGDEEDASQVERDWKDWLAHMGLPAEQPGLAKAQPVPGPRLVLIESPYRVVLAPLLAYIDAIRQEHSRATITVVLSEVVVAHWWQQPLHNQMPLRIKAALIHRPGIVLTDITYRIRPRE